MKQHVHFCTGTDGLRLAYAVHGSDPPVVRVATWLSHLELDWESPVWRHWLRRFGERHMLVRYDERGCGLSDTTIGDPSLDAWLGDLEAVVDAVGLERFAGPPARDRFDTPGRDWPGAGRGIYNP